MDWLFAARHGVSAFDLPLVCRMDKGSMCPSWDNFCGRVALPDLRRNFITCGDFGVIVVMSSIFDGFVVKYSSSDSM